MKKLLILLLALVMCLTALTSCDNVLGLFFDFQEPQPEEPAVTETQADNAIGLIKADYRDYEKNGTAGDVPELPTVMLQGDVTITWSIESNAEYVKLTEVPGKDGATGTITLDVNTDIDHDADVPYTLTAKATDKDGNERSITFNLFIPKFEPATHEDYMNAKSGDKLTVEGIVVAINSVKAGNKRNHLFLADVNGEGGYYCYNMNTDPLDDGIQVGMTVRVSGPISPSNGMQEFYKADFVKIVDETIKTVDPIDITELFVNGGNLDAYVAHPVTIKGVTLGGQSLAVETDQYLYFELGGKTSYIRTYYTDLPHTLVAADGDKTHKLAIEADHAAHYGWIADVTGLLIYYSGTPYLVPLEVECFTNYVEPERTDAEKVELELGKLTLPESVDENTTITLPLAGTSYSNVVLSWKTDNACAVVEGDKLIITLPAEKTKVTITVTATLGDVEPATKTFTIEVSALPTDLYVPEVQAPAVGTAFKYVVFQNKLGKTLYFNGKTAGSAWYLATTENSADAVDVYLEAVDGVEGGYRLYFYDGETKTYIRAYERTAGEAGKGKGSLELTATVPTEYYTYDATLGLYVVTSSDGLNKYYIGCYNDFDTMSCSNASYVNADNVGVTQFPSALATLAPAAYDTVINAPAVGTAFKYVVFQNKLGKTLYFNGKTAGSAWYLATTENAADAVDVYLEAVDGVEGGYRLYFYDGETKTYIRAYERTAGEAGKGKGSLELTATVPTEYYTYDATLGLYVVTSSDGLNKYYIGCYNDFDTMSCSNASYVNADNVGVTQFPSALATLELKKVGPEVQAPAVDTAFKYVVFQNKLGQVLYFNGKTAGSAWYLGTTTKISQAVDVYLEAVDGVEGGYRLYFYDGETKTYIRAYERTAGEAGKGKGSLELTATVPTEYYTYDATLGLYVVTSADGLNKYYIGCYNDFDTMSCSNASYVNADNVGVTQFPSALATIEFVKEDGGETPEPEHECESKCEICGKCKDAECGEDACTEKCPGCVAVVPPVSVTAPAVDTPYHLGLTQVTINKNLFITGNTASSAWYLATTEDLTAAIQVKLEAVDGVEGAYRIYFVKDDVKTYIRIYERDAAKGSGSLELVTETPNEYYTFDTTYNTLVLTSGENKYYLGTYNTFDTLSVSNYKYITSAGNFATQFYAVEGGETPEHVNKLVVGETNKIVVDGTTLNGYGLPVAWVEFVVTEKAGYTFVGNNNALAFICDAASNTANILCGGTGSATLEAGTYYICIGNGAVGEFNVTVTKTAIEAPVHTCESVCEECGKCLDKECADTACADKCQGHVSTIATIVAGENGDYIAEGTVVAVNGKSFILGDETGMILVWLNATPDVAVGDVVTVSGTTSVYNKGKQFGSNIVVTKTGTVAVEHGTATVLTADDLTAYKSATSITPKYVELTGKLSVSGNYYNVIVDGTEAQGSLKYLAGDLKTATDALNGWTIKVTGYAMALSGGKYVDIMVTSVEAVSLNVTVYYKNTTGWANVQFWAWNTENGNLVEGNWPGTAVMTLVDGTEDWYSYTVKLTSTAGFGFLFNDGAASGTQQTGNFTDLSKVWVYNNIAYATQAAADAKYAEDLAANIQYSEWFFAGSMNNWSTALNMLQLDADGNAWIEMTLEAGAEFKIAKGSSWNPQFNASQTADTTNFGGTDNIVVVNAGTYKFVVSADGSTLTITPVVEEVVESHKLVVTKGDTTYYVSGLGSSKTLTTTTDASAALEVYFEETDTEGQCYIYYMVDGAKAYITMTKNDTKAFATVSTSTEATAWTLNETNKQIVNATYTTRAFAFYANSSDIRTYATSGTQTWVWFE